MRSRRKKRLPRDKREDITQSRTALGNGYRRGRGSDKKSGDSDLVHLIGLGVDDMNAAGHTGIKGMNGS